MNITVYLGSRCGNRFCYAEYAYALGPGLPATGTPSFTVAAGLGSWGNWLTVLCRSEPSHRRGTAVLHG